MIKNYNILDDKCIMEQLKFDQNMFKNQMRDYKTKEYFKLRKDLQLVIRVHPLK